MDPLLARVALVALLLLATTAIGMVVRARSGRVATASDREGTEAILFGSPTCAPCDTVKDLLTEIEHERAGFVWRYVDAADDLDLAREHRVRSVPTLVVFDADGREAARSTGVPRRDELRAVVVGEVAQAA